jgi:hypothetical protein
VKQIPSKTANPIKADISTALEQGIKLEWEDVYDFVNPFGDRRGDIFNSIWTFDLDKNLIFLTKQDSVHSAPLNSVFNDHSPWTTFIRWTLETKQLKVSSLFQSHIGTSKWISLHGDDRFWAEY